MAKAQYCSNPFCDTKNYLLTSESVTMGHPDKVADCISDSILDAMLEKDPASRVACETLVTTGMVFVAGEITTKAVVDIPEVVRQTIKKIGYTDPSLGFDYETCAVIINLDKQSPDISIGVTEGEWPSQGTGSRRPGFDVRLCLQRNPFIYADANLACTRPQPQTRTDASDKKTAMAEAGRQKPGHCRIRKWKTKTHTYRRYRGATFTGYYLSTIEKRNYRKDYPACPAEKNGR